MRELFSRLKVQLALAVAVVGALMPSQASAILITPASTNFSANYAGSNAALVNDVATGAIAYTTGAVPVLYGVNSGGFELAGAPLKDNISVTFSGGPTSPPANALVTISGASIDMSAKAFLLVKDGLATPGYYLFNLQTLGYNGTDNIELKDFWPDAGRIDYVALFGSAGGAGNAVPEPATLSMLVIGLGCVAGRRALRRTKA